MDHKALGYRGEALAAEYLRDKGYEILETNFTIAGSEIDLVMREKSTIVFVEVKTRTSETFGTGEESVQRLKKRHLAKGIRRYLAEKVLQPDPDYRLDLIEIRLHAQTQKIAKLTHFKDIDV